MTTLNDLLQDPSKTERIQAALNVLLEAPYFYKTDNEDLFLKRSLKKNPATTMKASAKS